MPTPELLAEAAHQMTVCNACRYCEGYCAVFPAMMRRRTFPAAEMIFLAHLCHDCRGCYYACQYAPPHALAINVPRTLAEIRAAHQAEQAWPGALARHGATLIAAAVALAVALAWVGLQGAGGPPPPGDFYAVIPHRWMALAAGLALAFGIGALIPGWRRFWRDAGPGRVPGSGRGALLRALGAAATLRYLAGGGGGCSYPGEASSQTRRYLHQVTAYGFALCLAATLVATVYHYLLGLAAPYPLASLPVVLGTLGGIGLVVGPAGLLGLKLASDRAAGPVSAAEIAFLVLLLAVSLTGLALLVLRDGAAMPALLAVHLAVVLALLATLPYTKLAHAGYRLAALVRHAAEDQGG